MNERKKILITFLFALLCVSLTAQSVSATGCTVGAKSGTCKDTCASSEQLLSPSSCSGATSSCCAPAPTASAGGGASAITISNPLEYDTVEGFVASVMGAIQNIVVVLAILAIVIGGTIYVISAGNSTLLTHAKGAITGALIGLAIVLAAPSFLKEVYTIVGGKSMPSQLDGALSLTQIAMKALQFLLGIVGILAVIMLLIGGIAYMTAGGDKARADVGRDIVKNALIGIAIVMGALILVQQIASFFS